MGRFTGLLGLVVILAVAFLLSSHRRSIRPRILAWGLGLQFLRHIERTRMLAFLIPIDAMDWQAEYDQLRHEIAEYSAELAAKPHCVVFTKMDLLGEEYAPPIQASGAFGLFAVSAAAREGLDALIAAWWTELLRLKQSVRPEDVTLSLP